MKNLITLLLIGFITLNTNADPYQFSLANTIKPQPQKTTGFDKRKLIFGPGIGVGIMPRAFSIYLAPSVAYCLTDNFHVGTTIGFNYYQEAFDYNNLLTGAKETYKYRAPAYSFSIYARYLAFNRLLLGIEPEINNTKYTASQLHYNTSTGKLQETSTRLTIPACLVGVGYAQRFGRLGYSYVMIAYDLVQNPNARYYQTLDYRVGIMISPWQ